MRRVAIALGFFVMTAAAAPALADQPAPLPPLPPPPAATTATPTPAGAPTTTQTAAPTPAAQPAALVVAMSGAADAARALAQSLGLGAPVPPESAPGVAAEDPASVAALSDLAHKLNARALVVVHMEGGLPVARVFRADTGSFDATTYVPDDARTLQWGGAAQAIAGTVGIAPPAPPPTGPMQAPALATHEEPAPVTEPPKKRAFYESGWFWGALGAAAFAGGAVYFATRDNGPVPIHLEMQVPH
ncbi:MAG TPA: hypothetical protein VMI75_17360 [Polyangiaceae bacterium]|nr:hypothetical protein [Polyangiaceae bacterium]